MDRASYEWVGSVSGSVVCVCAAMTTSKQLYARVAKCSAECHTAVFTY